MDMSQDYFTQMKKQQLQKRTKIKFFSFNIY